MAQAICRIAADVQTDLGAHGVQGVDHLLTAGELGAAEQGIRVFQDFFVDIDFPVALTQHDEVSVPVARSLAAESAPGYPATRD